MATVREQHLLCATAEVSIKTLRKFLVGTEPVRPGTRERIERALVTLNLKHLRHAPKPETSKRRRSARGPRVR
jgi:DNA-binding LacI/PurR family transcriptional regulator